MDSKIKELICFDLDGTLLHSRKAHSLAFKKALRKLKIPTKTHKYIQSQFGKPAMEVSKALAPKEDKKIHKLILKWHDYYLYRETKKHTTRIKGVISTLKKLKKNYKLGIVSNSRHKNILLLLKAAKLDKKMFDVIVGNDDVKHPKPCPDEIFKAEKLSHTNADYIIGDTIYDIMAAKRAKTKPIVVLTGTQTRKKLKSKNPYKIIKSVNDLPKILK